MVFVKVVIGGHNDFSYCALPHLVPVAVAALQGVNTLNENLKILILIHYKL